MTHERTRSVNMLFVSVSGNEHPSDSPRSTLDEPSDLCGHGTLKNSTPALSGVLQVENFGKAFVVAARTLPENRTWLIFRPQGLVSNLKPSLKTTTDHDSCVV